MRRGKGGGEGKWERGKRTERIGRGVGKMGECEGEIDGRKERKRKRDEGGNRDLIRMEGRGRIRCNILTKWYLSDIWTS